MEFSGLVFFPPKKKKRSERRRRGGRSVRGTGAPGTRSTSGGRVIGSVGSVGSDARLLDSRSLGTAITAAPGYGWGLQDPFLVREIEEHGASGRTWGVGGP